MTGFADWKASPGPIIRRHRRSYCHRVTGRLIAGDVIFFEVIPVAVGVGAFVREATLVGVAAAGLLTASALVGAFLFQLQVQMLDRAAAWADTHPDPGAETTEIGELYEEISGNAGYAALVAVTTAFVLGVCSIATATDHPSLWLRGCSALAIGLLVHEFVTMLLVLRRTFTLTVKRVGAARAGVGR